MLKAMFSGRMEVSIYYSTKTLVIVVCKKLALTNIIFRKKCLMVNALNTDQGVVSEPTAK